jgi:hypothetical protein
MKSEKDRVKMNKIHTKWKYCVEVQKILLKSWQSRLTRCGVKYGLLHGALNGKDMNELA